MTGYDFNGVVDTGKYRPNADDVIITGNTDVETVQRWLRAEKIYCAVYFAPPRRSGHSQYASAVWKCEMIQRLGVTKFYEDDTEQAEIITAACPDVNVVRVF